MSESTHFLVTAFIFVACTVLPWLLFGLFFQPRTESALPASGRLVLYGLFGAVIGAGIILETGIPVWANHVPPVMVYAVTPALIAGGLGLLFHLEYSGEFPRPGLLLLKPILVLLFSLCAGALCAAALLRSQEAPQERTIVSPARQ